MRDGIEVRVLPFRRDVIAQLVRGIGVAVEGEFLLAGHRQESASNDRQHREVGGQMALTPLVIDEETAHMRD